MLHWITLCYKCIVLECNVTQRFRQLTTWFSRYICFVFARFNVEVDVCWCSSSSFPVYNSLSRCYLGWKSIDVLRNISPSSGLKNKPSKKAAWKQNYICSSETSVIFDGLHSFMSQKIYLFIATVVEPQILRINLIFILRNIILHPCFPQLCSDSLLPLCITRARNTIVFPGLYVHLYSVLQDIHVFDLAFILQSTWPLLGRQVSFSSDALR
jgi:hypothetical protein